MNAKLLELAERRASLVARAATQRVELSQRFAPWQAPLAVVDQGVAAVRYLRNHPGVLALIVTFAVVSRPRRVVSWLRRGWLLWRIMRVVKKGLADI